MAHIRTSWHKDTAPIGTMEDFKRPNHNDFATAAELKASGFTGMRHNSISGDCEIWLLGDIAARISKAEVELNPRAIDKAYADVFHLHECAPDHPEIRAYHQSLKDKEKP